MVWKRKMETSTPKQFHFTPKMPGFGHMIRISKEVEIPDHVWIFLNEKSMWKGSTSNSPDEYSLWEFGDTEVQSAREYLAEHGYQERKPNET